MDGSTVRIPDSPENRAHFGGQSGRNKSESGYPMLRIVVLMVLRSHLLAAANFGAYGSAEIQYARPLTASIPKRSLTILDRGFFGARLLLDIQSGEDRHWLTRARSTLNPRVLQRFARGDELIELPVTSHALKRPCPRTAAARAFLGQR